MKFALVFTLFLHQPPADRWFAADKVKHFFAASFGQSAAYGGLRALGLQHGASLGGATAATAIASIGKEISDRRHGSRVSARDLVWDAAGAGASTVLISHAIR